MSLARARLLAGAAALLGLVGLVVPAGAESCAGRGGAGEVVGLGPAQDTAVAYPARGTTPGALAVRRLTSLDGLEVRRGLRAWIKVRAAGVPGLTTGHHLGSGAARRDALVVETVDEGCPALVVSAVDTRPGRDRWRTTLTLPGGGQSDTGWLVTGVADVTGDGVDDALLEVRTLHGGERLSSPDGRVSTEQAVGGRVWLLDGRRGRVSTLASQPATVGPGPVGVVLSGRTTLVGTTTATPAGGPALALVARRDGRTTWRTTVATQRHLGVVRETRVGPLLTSSTSLLGLRPPVAVTHEVVQLDRRSGREVWRRTWSDRGTLQVLVAGGDPVVRLGETGQLLALSATDGATRWAGDVDRNGGERVLADLDGDRVGDLYSPGLDDATVVLSGRTGARLLPEVMSHLLPDVTAVGDLDGDGRADLVGTLAGQLVAETLAGATSPVPAGLAAVSGRTGEVLWSTGERMGHLSVTSGVLRPGAGRDVVVHDLDTGLVRLVAGRTGLTLWQRDLDDSAA